MTTEAIMDLDTADVLFDLGAGEEPVRAGYELCSIFRLPSAS